MYRSGTCISEFGLSSLFCTCSKLRLKRGQVCIHDYTTLYSQHYIVYMALVSLGDF